MVQSDNGDDDKIVEQDLSASVRAVEINGGEVKNVDTSLPNTSSVRDAEVDRSTPSSSSLSVRQEEEFLFNLAVDLVRNSDSSTSSNGAVIGNDVKLRMYGLFKRVTVGRLFSVAEKAAYYRTSGCHNDSDDEKEHQGDHGKRESSSSSVFFEDRPGVFHPVARAKYDAWRECNVMTRRGGLLEYLKILVDEIFFNDCAEDETITLFKERYRRLISSASRDLGTTNTGCNTLRSSHVARTEPDGREGDEDEGEDDNVSGNVPNVRDSDYDSFIESYTNSIDVVAGERNTISRRKYECQRRESSEHIRHTEDTDARKSSTIIRDRTQPMQLSNCNLDRRCKKRSRTGILTHIHAVRAKLSVYPRGRIDIAFPDLCYAMWECIHPRYYIEAILSRTTARTRRLTYLRNQVMLEHLWADFSKTDTVRVRGMAGEDESVGQATTIKKRLQKEQELDWNVIITSSVRSGFDLYLRAKNYPPNSEIIMTAIQIPQMVQIAEYHGLDVIPVDCHVGTLVPSIQRIESQITERTVAVMIVHPFGFIGYDDHEFETLRRTLRRKRSSSSNSKIQIDLLEDCAECFARGRPTSSVQWDYYGSRHADVSFFSFGIIKTCTALGGGVVILRSTDKSDDTDDDLFVATSNTGSEMRRIQDTYPISSNQRFLWKVIKVCFIHFISSSCLLYGIIMIIITRVLRIDFDHFVTNALRGYHDECYLRRRQKKLLLSNKVASAKHRNSYRTVKQDELSSSQKLMRRLHCRPSPANLALMHRRLRSISASTNVEARIERCQRFAAILKRQVPQVILPGADRCGGQYRKHLYWLFPIVVDDRDYVNRCLLEAGFDVPHGTSQLCCVETCTSSQPMTNKLHESSKFMSKILYLPVAFYKTSQEDMQHMVSVLDYATRGKNKKNIRCVQNHGQESQESHVAYPSAGCGDRFEYFTWIGILLSTSIVPIIIMSLLMSQSTCAITIFQNIVRLSLTLHRLLMCLTRVGIFIILFTSWIRHLLAPGYLASKAFIRNIQEQSQHGNDAFSATTTSSFGKSGNDEKKPGKLSNPSFRLMDVPVLRIENRSGSLDCCSPKKVLLTGATGFVGSMLLYDLLFHRKEWGVDGVVLFCRGMGAKSAKERISTLLNRPMYSFLSAKEKQSTDLIVVIESDVAKPGLGMSPRVRKHLSTLQITHVIHCAASVSFIQKLDEAAKSNITPALQLQALAKQLGNARFIYVSTAFVHGNETGSSPQNSYDDGAVPPLPEELFPLGRYDPCRLYQSMLETQSFAYSAMHEFGFPNTYTFSKCVCEHLLLLRDHESNSNTMIVRPGIVGPSVVCPWEGWAGNKPSTLVAAACLYLKNQWSLWSFGGTKIAVTPVDIVSRFILCKAFDGRFYDNAVDVHAVSPIVHSFADDSYRPVQEQDTDAAPPFAASSHASPSNSFPLKWCGNTTKKIYNATWDWKSPSSSNFTWNQFAEVMVKVGCIQGYYSRLTACLVHLVNIQYIPSLDLSGESFRRLHQACVKIPFQLFLTVLSILRSTKKAEKVEMLMKFLDLPVLFLHFSNSNFRFSSELIAPQSFDGERYMVRCCCLAADRFSRRLREKNNKFDSTTTCETIGEERPTSSYLVAGYRHKPCCSDAWWALTQPQGSFIIRVAGFLLLKLLRRTTSELTVDMDSFSGLSQVLHDKETATVRRYIVLVPTHRSIFDFLIVSFIVFALPELGIPIPFVCASEDFCRVPVVGFVMKLAQAIFVRRGRGKPDADLTKRIAQLKKYCDGGDSCFEVFIEGKRSRDRRFVPPKTGFLRCLVQTGGSHVILPITINYERIPEHVTLMRELDDARRTKSQMSLTGLFKWFQNVRRGTVNTGRIHLAAAQPISIPRVEAAASIPEITRKIQQKQQNLIYVSDYHINAGARILEIPYETMKNALTEVGCKFWPGKDRGMAREFEQHGTGPFGVPHVIPISKTELWTAILHFGHYFAPCFDGFDSGWAKWLDPNFSTLKEHSFKQSPHLETVVKGLKGHFDEAKKEIEETISRLQAEGFSVPRDEHVLQHLARVDSKSPMLLACAALQMRIKSHDVRVNTDHENEDFALGSTTVKSNHRKMEPMGPYLRIDEDKFVSSVEASQYSDTSREEESFGAWGFHDSSFVLYVDEIGSKLVSMRGDRYDISDTPMHNLLPFIERELGITIDPRNIFLPSTIADPSFVSNSEIGTEEVNHILEVLKRPQNDGSRAGPVSTFPADRLRHGTGHTQHDMYLLRSGLFSVDFRAPDAVVWPSNEREVVEIVKLARRKGWCLIPFGGGTNVSGAVWCPSKHDEPRPVISVDMKEMNRILWINEENGVAHVQAGITGRALQRELEGRGLTFGHEPDSIEFSTLGGWVATKASGMKRNRYGNIEDMVKEVRVVGADGMLCQHHNIHDSYCEHDEIFAVRGGSAFGRSSTGLDLSSFMFGSEGCLGIITSVVINVWQIAECKDFQSVLFPSFNAGLCFVKEISKMHSLKPASVRLFDNEQFRLGQAMKHEPRSAIKKAKAFLTKLAGEHIHGFSMKSIVGVAIAFEGSFVDIDMQKRMIKSLSQKYSGVLAGSIAGKAGYDLTFAIAYLRDFAMSYYCLGESFETFVPWSNVEDLIASTKKRIQKEHLLRSLPGKPFVSCRVTQLYYEGACLYFYLCIYVENVSRPSEVFAQIQTAAREEILRSGGNLSHHHGCGKIRSPFMSKVNSEPMRKALRRIKKSFDPDNIFGAKNGAFG